MLPDFSSPDVTNKFESGGYNLKEYYLRNVKWMSSITIGIVIMISLHETLLMWDAIRIGTFRAVFWKKNIIRLIFIAILLTVLVSGHLEKSRYGNKVLSKNGRSLHIACTVLFLAAFVVFIIRHSWDAVPG